MGQKLDDKTYFRANLNNNAIVINGDDYRKFHPNFDEIQKNEGRLSAKFTQEFASKITERLIQKAKQLEEKAKAKNLDSNASKGLK
ncbi:zeta toxin family protein [Campylobacteraceae bacterium]|uniref:zeta toxin family protein n=1 Tax=uncultured Campylobacter sp. TaxID=218934 RepID=UPI0015B0BBC0